MRKSDDKMYSKELLRKHEDDDFDEDVEEEDDNPDDPEPFDAFDEDTSAYIGRADEFDPNELETIQSQTHERWMLQCLDDGIPGKYPFPRLLTYYEVRGLPRGTEIDFKEGCSKVIVHDLKDHEDLFKLKKDCPAAMDSDTRGLYLRTCCYIEEAN